MVDSVWSATMQTYLYLMFLIKELFEINMNIVLYNSSNLLINMCYVSFCCFKEDNIVFDDFAFIYIFLLDTELSRLKAENRSLAEELAQCQVNIFS